MVSRIDGLNNMRAHLRPAIFSFSDQDLSNESSNSEGDYSHEDTSISEQLRNRPCISLTLTLPLPVADVMVSIISSGLSPYKKRSAVLLNQYMLPVMVRRLCHDSITMHNKLHLLLAEPFNFSEDVTCRRHSSNVLTLADPFGSHFDGLIPQGAGRHKG